MRPMVIAEKRIDKYNSVNDIIWDNQNKCTYRHAVIAYETFYSITFVIKHYKQNSVYYQPDKIWSKI